MGEVVRGDVQQWADGRWRTVLTVSGIPVADRRRTRAPDDRAPDDRYGWDRQAAGSTLFTVFDQRFAERWPP